MSKVTGYCHRYFSKVTVTVTVTSYFGNNVTNDTEVNRELIGLEPVSSMINKSRQRWFGHVKCKWVKRYMMLETEGIRHTVL